MYRLLLLAFRSLLQAQDLMPIEEGRPSRWRDGLARSFVHCGRPSQYVLPLGISLAMGLKEEGRSVWLVATLGPFGPGVKRDSYGAPRRTVQRSVD